MELVYNFEVLCTFQHDASTHINNGWFEPRYYKERCTVEYYYDVDISKTDLEEYFGHTISPELFSYIDVEALEEDGDFIEFMMDKYNDKAFEACEEETAE